MSKDKKKITKDMTFAEIMEVNEDAGALLANKGLFCGGCPMAAFETLENGAAKHGVDLDQLLKDLNEGGSNPEDSGGSASQDGSESKILGGSTASGACESEEDC